MDAGRKICGWFRSLGAVNHNTNIQNGNIKDESITRRLEALGVNEGTPVNILNKKGSGSVIIKVRGTRLALGKRLSEGITVREEQAS